MKNQIGQGIPVFHGVKQRGNGLGSVLGGLARYAIPQIMRYIVSHAKQAKYNTVSDIALRGQGFKQALKSNGIGFLKNGGDDLINSSNSQPQSGKGIANSKIKIGTPVTSLTRTSIKRMNVQLKKKPGKRRIARKKVVKRKALEN